MKRRAFFAVSAATVADSTLGQPRSAHALTNLMAPENKLEVYARMRGGIDGERVLCWWSANIWAKRNDDIAVKLMTAEGLTFSRVVRNSDGSLGYSQAGRGTYRDAETGKPLTKFTNPITGVKGEPDRIRSHSTGVIGTKGMVQEPSDRLIQLDSEISDPVVNAGQVFLRDNFVAKYQGVKQGAAPFTGSSLTTYVAAAGDIENDSAKFRPGNFFYQSLGGFSPWMGMDDATGMMSWQTLGQKLYNGAASAPEDIRKWVEENYPGFLSDPHI